MPEPRLCPYRERGLECRTARADGACRCFGPPEQSEALRDVLGMLRQADRDLTGLRPEIAQQTLRDAIAALADTLGLSDPTPQELAAYRERVAAQGRAIDAILNEEGRRQRKRKR